MSRRLARFRPSIFGGNLIPVTVLAANAALISVLSVLRYETFTDAWDFGGYVQAFSSVLRGEVFQYTLNSFFYSGFPHQLSFSFFGTHFSPILFLVLPFYAIWPHPETLLVLQALLLTIGGVPVYLLAKGQLGYSSGLGFLGIYLVYPALVGLGLNDFHVESFIPTFMLFGIFFGLERKWASSTIFFVLAALVIEEAGILVAFGVVFLGVNHKAWKRPRTLVLCSALVASALAYSLLAAEARYLFGLDPSGFSATLNSQNYSILGASSALQVPGAVLSHPDRAFAALQFAFPQKFTWLFSLVGSVPTVFLYPEGLLLALPWLSVSLFSNYAGYYSIYGMHQSFILFSVFPAAILGLSRLRTMLPDHLNKFLAAMLIITFVFAALYDLPPGVYGTSFTLTSHDVSKERVVSLLPPYGSVLTTSDILPHVAQRPEAYVLPPLTLRQGYATIDGQILANINPQFILVDMGSTSGNIQAENSAILAGKVYSGGYGLVAYDDKVMLLKMGYSGTPELYEPTIVFNSTNLSPGPHAVSYMNQTIYLPAGGGQEAMFFGPYIYLGPGTYSATFTLRLFGNPAPQSNIITLDVAYGQVTEVVAKTVTARDFTGSGEAIITVRFNLEQPAFDLQFRGLMPNPGVGIALENIKIGIGS